MNGATDFKYAERLLSDFDIMICSFDGGTGVNTVETGSQITFNTISTINGSKNRSYGTRYDGSLTTTFQGCKVDKYCHPIEIEPREFGKINRWLNRKEFHSFSINQEGYNNIHFNGSFNIKQIEVNGKIYGIEFTFTSDTPYGLENDRKIVFTTTDSNKSYTYFDNSDEIGDLCPFTKITCLESGKLRITNSMDDEVLTIENCEVNEVITIDNENLVIRSNKETHDIVNDFNYSYLHISNDEAGNNKNVFTTSIKCKVEMTYNPIRKVGI